MKDSERLFGGADLVSQLARVACIGVSQAQKTCCKLCFSLRSCNLCQEVFRERETKREEERERKRKREKESTEKEGETDKEREIVQGERRREKEHRESERAERARRLQESV